MAKSEPLDVSGLMAMLSQMPADAPVFSWNSGLDTPLLPENVVFEEKAGLVMIW